MCWSSSNGYHQKPLLEQELPTLPEHLSSPIVFRGFVLLKIYYLCGVLRSNKYQFYGLWFNPTGARTQHWR
jgi:hypothetical protein